MFTLGLIALSAALYGIHYLIFRDAHHIALYLLGDIAFLPIDVLIVTLIIHRILSDREKRALLNKLNMVIGAFFSEVGTPLLALLAPMNAGHDTIRRMLIPKQDWPDKEFAKVRGRLKAHVFTVDVKTGDLEAVKGYLKDKREFLLRLLENPNLLEHESFTELMWAVFHLTEELVQRRNLTKLHEADLAHLSGDAKRAYTFLLTEWISYMRHLKRSYPYLYSLAVRTNPFDPEARVELS